MICYLYAQKQTKKNNTFKEQIDRFTTASM